MGFRKQLGIINVETTKNNKPMARKKINLEKLVSSLETIAKNHGFNFEHDADVKEITILGCNIPTLADVRDVCEELGVSKKNINAYELFHMISVSY